MKKRLMIVLLPFLMLASLFAQTKEFNKVMLLQPEEVLSERCTDVNELSNYIKGVQAAIKPFASGSKSIGDGYIVLALRPVAKSNVWFDLEDAKNTDALKKKILAVPPCHVQGGVLLVVLSNLDAPQERLPLPEEWKPTLEEMGGSAEISAVVDAVWPAEITKKEKDSLLKLIGNFEKEKDFSQASLKKYSDIITFASESEVVHITIDEDSWPEEVQKSKYGSMFLLAFIAGNMKNQLTTDVYESSSEAGIQFELLKYKQLKKTDKTLSLSFFEKME